MNHDLLKKYSLEVTKKHLDPAVVDMIVAYTSWVPPPHYSWIKMMIQQDNVVCFVCGRLFDERTAMCNTTFTKCLCTGPRCARCWSHQLFKDYTFGPCFWHYN
jgi:hypothetical protein